MLFLGLAFLVIAENGYLLPVVLPFCLVIAVQLVRAVRLPGREGLPKAEVPARSLRRWHVAAVVAVVATSSIWVVQRVLTEYVFTGCGLLEGSVPCWVVFILLDLSLVAAAGITVFSVLYLGKLRIVGYRLGEFLAFGALVIPMAVAWAALQVFVADVESDWVEVSGSPFALVTGLVGVVMFMFLLAWDGGRLKTWLLAAACLLLLVSISGANQPWNPFAMFAAVVVGYAIYRIEWKRMLASSAAEATAQVGQERLKLEYAVAAAATLLAVAATVHLIAMPAVEGMTGSAGVAAQYWKPVLAGYALVGAVVVVTTTATRRLLQIRPFATVLILPAAILLPAERFFYLDDYFVSRDVSQMIIEAAITAAILWAMWYVFGPGKRRDATSPTRPEG